jgi:peptidoglycan/LPS O-acetylase OafA/YrhL
MRRYRPITMNQGALPQARYRADIDGLRAIAVLSVIFFHADFRWAQGGFSGVDVFFVISGYLITGILRRDLDAGTFSLSRFYERRARRILPALILVLAVTLGACRVLMLTADIPAVGRSAVSVLLFAANIMFWRGADFGDLTLVNYFGRRIHEQPLVHTWSLGVEEQYYVLFPLAIYLVWRLSRSLVLPALLAGFLASFALSVWLTPIAPGIAFYLLPTRGWELLAGGLISWSGSPRFERPRLRESAPVIGLLLVVFAATWFNSSTPFPGYAALAPVTGTALLLRYAPGSRVGRLLSWRPLVLIGLMSYSAYLWHQPLFALARYLSANGDLDRSVAIVLSAAALMLARLSWRYVETPFRDPRQVPRRRLAWCGAGAIMAVAIAASLLAFGSSAGRRTPVATNIVAQSLLSMFSDCTITSNLHALGVGCLTNPSSSERPKFLVVGDSHADALFPAFVKISRDLGVQGRLLDLSACSPLLEVTAVPTSTPDCLRTRDRALQMVADQQITTVFLASRFSFAYGSPATFESRLARTIDAYASRGALVHLVEQAPEQPYYQRRVYLRAVLGQRFLGIDATPVIEAMTVNRSEHDQQQALVRSAFDRYRDDPRVRIIDFTDVLCGATCPPATTGEPYYNDEQHLSAAGALLVAREIARQSALPEPK